MIYFSSQERRVMGRKILYLGILFILSGCVTTSEIREAEIQNLREKLSYLESQLKQKEEENLILKKELTKLQREKPKEKIILRMPNAREIQTALKNAGFYDGEIDGVIGPKTKEAIKKFQEKNGLNPDGVVGSRTWEKLQNYLNP